MARVAEGRKQLKAAAAPSRNAVHKSFGSLLELCGLSRDLVSVERRKSAGAATAEKAAQGSQGAPASSHGLRSSPSGSRLRDTGWSWRHACALTGNGIHRVQVLRVLFTGPVLDAQAVARSGVRSPPRGHKRPVRSTF